MKKTFVFLWCALVGCTIVPDDSFESKPKSSLAKIVLTANGGRNSWGNPYPASTLTGVVTHSSNKMSVKFEGSLDPFWFNTKVQEIEYEFNSQKLLSGILIAFQGGGTQSESFTYNAAGNLLRANISYVTTDGTDVEYDYDFYYTADAALDSIAKKVTLVKGNTQVIRGFYKAVPEQYSFGTAVAFYSVFPYTQGDNIESPYMMGCSGYVPTNDLNKSYHRLSKDAPFNFTENLCVVEKDNVLTLELALTVYSVSLLPYTKQVNDYSYDLESNNSNCLEHLSGPSYYRLLPEMNFNYSVLEMLNIAEERYWINLEPERVSPILEMNVSFEYNFAE